MKRPGPFAGAVKALPLCFLGKLGDLRHRSCEMPTRFPLRDAQGDALLRAVLAADAADKLGLRRLSAFFPSLAERLTAAMKQTRAHQRNADLACRHYLCAEALTEVLEARIADGRGRQGDARGEIVDDYSALVPAKLKAFSKRAIAQRRSIQSAYPEVDLPLVGRALRERLLAPEFAAGVLEDSVNYEALLRKLRASSRRSR